MDELLHTHAQHLRNIREGLEDVITSNARFRDLGDESWRKLKNLLAYVDELERKAIAEWEAF